MRRLRIVLLVSVAATPAAVGQPKPGPVTPVTAANQTGCRIAFVNLPALLKGMVGYAGAEKAYIAEVEASRTEAEQVRAPFDSAVAQYQSSQAMMSASSRASREKQLRAQQDTVESKLQRLSDRVASREKELLAPLRDRIRAVVDGIRAEANYAMVIDLASPGSEAVYAYDRSMDITAKVAQRLNGPPGN